MEPSDEIRRHYEHRIRPDRESWKVLDWSTPQSQLDRFAVLADHVELNGRSLLDVGCGLGCLWAFLKERNIRPEYLGVDLVDKMVNAARASHPDGTFAVHNVFEPDPAWDRRFDVVFASGTFNLNLGNNLEFLPRAIERLWTLTDGVLAFNLLHQRAAMETDRYFFYDPEQVRTFLPVEADVKILDDYLPNDFTCLCRRL